VAIVYTYQEIRTVLSSLSACFGTSNKQSNLQEAKQEEEDEITERVFESFVEMIELI
jgi:hypothetical protein